MPAMQELRETPVRSLGQEDSSEKEMATPPVFLSGKSCGQRSLVGYSPQGRKETQAKQPSVHALQRLRILC